MMIEKTKTKQRSQPSRKGKKSWRRNIDGTAVEQAIALKSENERLGLDKVSEVPDDALFVFDRTGQQGLALKNRKRNNIDIVGKILDSRHGIIRPLVARQISVTSELRRSLETKKRGLSLTEQKIVLKKAKKLQKSLSAKEGGDNCFGNITTTDLWDEKNNLLLLKAVDDSNNIIKNRNNDDPPLGVSMNGMAIPSQIKRSKVPLAKQAIPAVNPAPPGSSYNPSADSHKKLLEHSNRLKKITEKANAQALKAHYACYVNVSKGNTTDSDLVPPKPLFGESKILDNEVSLPKTPSRRITKAKRNLLKKKIKARNLIEKRIKEKKEMKDASMAVEIMEKVLEKEQKHKSFLEARKLRRLQMPKRLCLSRFIQEDSLESKVPCLSVEDLPGSLRAVRQFGNLIQDSFKSFQARNMIETRLRTSKFRKYSLQQYVKRGYKDFDLFNPAIMPLAAGEEEEDDNDY